MHLEEARRYPGDKPCKPLAPARPHTFLARRVGRAVHGSDHKCLHGDTSAHRFVWRDGWRWREEEQEEQEEERESGRMGRLTNSAEVATLLREDAPDIAGVLALLARLAPTLTQLVLVRPFFARGAGG